MTTDIIDTPTSLQQIFSTLKHGQHAWNKLLLSDRINVITRFVELLRKNEDKLARDLHKENGKPLQEAHNEIKGACQRIQFFIDNTALTLQQKVMNEANGVKEILAFEPLGVIANISAWNYPFLVGVNVFIPALLAGNAVLYKPSEFATTTGINIETLLHQAGVPKDVFGAVFGDGQAGEAILHLPCDGYFFTGSYRVGKYIAEQVAHKLVPVGLELGGKDPIYVMDDVADIIQAAASLVEGAFYNNGQSCCAVERIYVHSAIYDEFVKHFVAEVKKLTYLAPLTRPDQTEVLADQVLDAVAKGATILTGGKPVHKKPAYFEPTVLTNVNHCMKVMNDESFGPIIGIQKVASDEEALRLMQETDYGLTAGVYGKDEQRAQKILQQLDVGTVYFNCCDRVSPYLPWSGRKHSGLGSTLSYLGILAFVKPKGYMLRNA